MSKVEKRTFSLTAEQADYIDTKVATGSYASSSEVVRAGLRALQERDAAIEKWLLEEVVPAYDAWQANPNAVLSADEVFDDIAADLAQLEKRKAS